MGAFDAVISYGVIRREIRVDADNVACHRNHTLSINNGVIRTCAFFLQITGPVGVHERRTIHTIIFKQVRDAAWVDFLRA